jgi:cell division protein FtsI (penicillin-binding protein 3)
MSDLKKVIYLRALLVFAGFCLMGALIIWRIFMLQFKEGDYWRQQAEDMTMRVEKIEPVRGSIFSDNGSLLSTSIPVFNIYVDFTAKKFSGKNIHSTLDSLAYALSALFNDRPVSEYRRILQQGRSRGYEYYLLKRNVTYRQLKKLKQMPVFRHGRFHGGLIAEQRHRRVKPYRWLAERTIGFKSMQSGQRSVGIEAAFDNELRGVSGWRVMQKIAAGVYKPLRSEGEVEPKDGKDIITTLNIYLQDVAENSLLHHLRLHRAKGGCVVLMEVSTGEIKAIANLVRDSDGNYRELYNLAVGHSSEPGSTFKLQALMAVLEDRKATIDDTVNTGQGVYFWLADKPMKDIREGGYGNITIRQAFAVSSNIGVSKVVHKAYAKNPMAFVNTLRRMKVDTPLNLQIHGEGHSFILDTSSRYWSRVALPYMAIGYSVKLTPLQILTFYNAVANNGKMVKPLLVKEIREQGRPIKVFQPEVLCESICSPATVRMAQEMLREVVVNGTAADLFKACQYTVAGKTGTARISRDGSYESDGQVKYQAAFVGYFPAEQPRYSCIVVFYEPEGGQFFASRVAAPVFRELADKIYSGSLEMHPEVQPDSSLLAGCNLPVKKGRLASLSVLGPDFNLPIPDQTEEEWIVLSKENGQSRVNPLIITPGRVPDVTGMGLRDAVLLLENLGLVVHAQGKGKVVAQSLHAGTPLVPGNTIHLELN